MMRKILTSKIHRATVTEADLHYVGSITIDQDLMDEAGMVEYECVLVADLDNGSRHETYVIPGERGSGVIRTNGAAARLVHVGDKVIIMAYALMDEAERANHRPQIVVVDGDNRPIERK